MCSLKEEARSLGVFFLRGATSLFFFIESNLRIPICISAPCHVTNVTIESDNDADKATCRLRRTNTRTATTCLVPGVRIVRENAITVAASVLNVLIVSRASAWKKLSSMRH